jgi:serine/threonine protein kinase
MGMMQKVEHPCIIKLLDNIDTEDRIFMFMVYCSGGDLMSRIRKRECRTENILLWNDTDETRLQICDFGYSKDITQSEMRNKKCPSNQKVPFNPKSAPGPKKCPLTQKLPPTLKSRYTLLSIYTH